MLLQTFLCTIAITWENSQSPTARYEKLEKLRHVIRSNNFVTQEETRPVAIALFSQPTMILHLGFDKPAMVEHGWYKNYNHPYLKSILSIIETLSKGEDLVKMQFLIAEGEDPMLGLQVRLEREQISPETSITKLAPTLQPQTIYQWNKV